MTGAERGGRRAGSRAGGEIMDAGAVSLPARAACRGLLQGPQTRTRNQGEGIQPPVVAFGVFFIYKCYFLSQIQS